MNDEKEKKKKLNPVYCRLCKKKIDRNTEKEGVDWIMPSRNFFYCVKCYNDWKVSSDHDEDDWIDLIYDFIARDLKVSYNYFMCEKQRESFIKKNHFTNKGIYFALKYFYEVKNGDWDKGHNGIGIVPFIYAEASQYWTARENQKEGTLAEIEKQIRARMSMSVVKATKANHTSKSKWSLDSI